MEESSIQPEKDPFAWRRKAKADLDLAREIVDKIGASDRYPAHVCFLCQQSIEKYLKLVLVSQCIIPSRTHDLRALIDRSSSFCSALTPLKETISWLTPFATEIRYPDEDEVTPGEVERALEQAGKVQEAVEVWFDQRRS